MAPKRILVTGAQGFIGSQLLPALKRQGYQVEASRADLLDFGGLNAELSEGTWDWVIHLAAISHVPTCEKDPALAYRVNVAGTATLLEAMSRPPRPPRLLFASTAQVYAAPAPAELGAQLEFDETRQLHPQNLYARTKRAAEALIEEAARRSDLGATVVRLFNHSHRSQSPDFFLPHLYQSLRATPAGQPVRIPVGNLNVGRDIGAVADLLDAIWTLLERTKALPSHEVFNICSGTAKNLATLARLLAQRLGVNAEFFVDPARVRPNEAALIRGSHRRLTEATGWLPRRASDEAALIDAFLA